MNEVELQAFVNGPVPEVQHRNVPHQYLHPDQCDEQTEYGTSAGSRYCGAPKAAGFKLCLHHLFTKLTEDTPATELRE